AAVSRPVVRVARIPAEVERRAADAPADASLLVERNVQARAGDGPLPDREPGGWRSGVGERFDRYRPVVRTARRASGREQEEDGAHDRLTLRPEIYSRKSGDYSSRSATAGSSRDARQAG